MEILMGRDSIGLAKIKERIDRGEVVGIAFEPGGAWRVDFVIVKTEFINYSTREKEKITIPGTNDDYYLFVHTNGSYLNYVFGSFASKSYLMSKFRWNDCKEMDDLEWFVNGIVTGHCTKCNNRIGECICEK